MGLKCVAHLLVLGAEMHLGAIVVLCVLF